MNIDNQDKGFIKTLYTGKAPIQIIASNPTRKQLAELLNKNIEDVKEPQYRKEEGGPTRIDFWYKNHPDFHTEFTGKFSLFIENETKSSQKSGNKQYIDDFTNTTWSLNLANLSAENEKKKEAFKIDIASVRECKKGEEEIYKLIKAYGKIRPKTKPLKLDSWENLIKGNCKELQEDVFDKINNDNGGCEIILGVKDNKYQDVYTNDFYPLGYTLNEYDMKNITGEYGYKSYRTTRFETYEPQALSENADFSNNLPDEVDDISNPFM